MTGVKYALSLRQPALPVDYKNINRIKQITEKVMKTIAEGKEPSPLRSRACKKTIQAEQPEERRSQTEQKASNIDICVLDQDRGVLVAVTFPASRQNLKSRYPCMRLRNADHAGRLCRADNLSRNEGTRYLESKIRCQHAPDLRFWSSTKYLNNIRPTTKCRL
jgi:hypothetical protein